MQMKKNFLYTLNVFLFIAIFASRSITDAIFVSKGIESNFLVDLKYVFLIFSFFISAILMYKKQNKKIIFKKQLYNVLFVTIAFATISIIFLLKNDFNKNTLVELFKLVLPAIYVFVFINTIKFEDLYKTMKWLLIFGILGYVLEIGTSVFSISNLKLINFSTSYSPFESHYASGIAIATCTFFSFYSKDKRYKYISLVFTILTFKRLAVLYALLLFVLPKIINVEKGVSKQLLFLTKVFFIIITVVYYTILLPTSAEAFESVLGINQKDFSTGRNTFLRWAYEANYRASGFGTLTPYINRNIEMDLVKIYMETTIIGLIIFVWCYWECVPNNIYMYIYMFYIFSSLLASHSLSNSFIWILLFIILTSVYLENSKNYIDLKNYKKRGEKKK